MSGEFKVLGPDGESDGGAFPIPPDIDPSEIPSRITAALTAAFAGGTEEPSKPEPTVAEIITQLVDRCERYIASYGTIDDPGCPFRVGSLVTPLEGSGYRGANEPHIVLETRRVKEPDFGPIEGGPTSNGYGCRRDVRVGYIGKRRSSYGYASFWIESFEFQNYTP